MSRSLQIATIFVVLIPVVTLSIGAAPLPGNRLQEPTTVGTPLAQPTFTVAATEVLTTTVTPTEGVTPTVAPTEAATEAASPTSTPPAFGKAEIDKIFPPGQGQDLVFTGCVNCHPWVPIVLVQGTAERWQRIMKDHKARVGMKEDDYAFLIQYLVDNFGPDKPVPDNIPEDLLMQWTSY